MASVELSRMVDARPEGDGHAMTVASSPSSPDALVMTMDPDAVALVVSALFGGDPGIAVAPITRDLSPTETVVASRVFEEIARGLGKAGDKSLDLTLPAAAGDQREPISRSTSCATGRECASCWPYPRRPARARSC